MMPQAQAGLLSKDAVTNARALLRYALPVDEQKAKPIRQVQVRKQQPIQFQILVLPTLIILLPQIGY